MAEEAPSSPKEKTLLNAISELREVSIEIRNIVFGEREKDEAKKPAEVTIVKNTVVKARDRITKITCRLKDIRRGLSLLK